MTRQNGQPVIGHITRAELIFLTAAFLAALIFRELIHVRLVPDSIEYLSFAQNILSGIHHTGDITIACYRRPPLYPHLIALLSFGKSSPAYLAEVGRQVSVFAGALLVFPLYFLGRGITGKTAAATAVLLAVVTPEFLYYSGIVLTESISTLIVCTSMLILWVLCSKGEVKVFSMLLLGCMLGLAFLSRHLAIGYLGISLGWLIFYRLILTRPMNSGTARVKRVVVSTLIVILGFLITVSPQVLYLRAETGKWALAKDPFSLSSKRVAKPGGDIRYTKAYEEIMSLTPDNERYLWEEKESPGLLSNISNQPGGYLKAYVATLLGGYTSDLYLPYPSIILILALVGLTGMVKEREFTKILFNLWGFGGTYLFLALFLNMRDRYMFSSYIFLLLLAGAGTAMAVKLAPCLVREEARKRKVRWGAGAFLFCIIVASLFPASRTLIKEQNSLDNRELLQRMGQYLSRKIEKNAVMFDRTPHIAYFSGGIKASPPYAEIDDVLHFARKRGVDYWIVSSFYVPWLRPQYAPLLDPNRDHHGLIPIAVYRQARKFIIIVYRILPD